MMDKQKKNELFCKYYARWIATYKQDAVRKVTMNKYNLTLQWLKKLVPKMTMNELTRLKYQQLLNDFAECHEKQSTMDFHHQLKGAILDAVDEGLIERDPTRKAIIKGKTPRPKNLNYIS